MLDKDFFTRDPITCSKALIGCDLVWDRCRGRIVETEAYAAIGDEACHTFLRRGAQRFVNDHPPGTAYIYLNYGVHWLLNVLVKSLAGEEGFVLIRALEPLDGISLMQKRRNQQDIRNLCSGPGKLTQAMAIPPTFHGSSLCEHPRHAFHAPAPGEVKPEVVSDIRIGISRAADLPWRFLARGSRFVSRPPIGQKPATEAPLL
jgi:DNA-3-methyladenine glycosylase